MRARRVRRIALVVVLSIVVVMVVAAVTGVLDEPQWLGCRTERTEREVAEVVPVDPPVEISTEPVSDVIAGVAVAQDPVRRDWWLTTKNGMVQHLDEELANPEVELQFDVPTGDEQGALGIVVDAEGENLYFSYTDLDDDVHVLGYELDDEGVVEDSEREVLFIDHPRDTHNGGWLVIDDEGYLWISMGDGGGAMGKQSLFGRLLQGGQLPLAENAQDRSQLLGKLLRIDPEPTGDEAYGIPADNPFVGDDDAREEIWAYGLRNPWQFSIDAETGDLWIGDVGQECYEAIDVARGDDGAGAGENFGWGHYEGQHLFEGGELEDSVLPVVEFPHSDGWCSIVGGQVYRGSAIPELVGWYVFTDTCRQEILATREADDGSWETTTIGTAPQLPVSFSADQDGELYVVSIAQGIYRLESATGETTATTDGNSE